MSRQFMTFAAFLATASSIQVLEPSGGPFPSSGKILLRWRRSSSPATTAIARIQYGDVLDGTLYPDFQRQIALQTDGNVGRDDIGEIELDTGLEACGGCWIRMEAVGLDSDQWGYSTFYEGNNGPVKASNGAQEEEPAKEEPSDQGKKEEEKPQEPSSEQSSEEPKESQGSVPPQTGTIGDMIDQGIGQQEERMKELENEPEPKSEIDELDLDARKIDGLVDMADNNSPISEGTTEEDQEEQDETTEDSEEENADEEEQNVDNEDDDDSTSGAGFMDLGQVILAVSIAASALL